MFICYGTIDCLVQYACVLFCSIANNLRGKACECLVLNSVNNYSGQIATVYCVGCVIECAVQALTVELFLSWCAHRVFVLWTFLRPV